MPVTMDVIRKKRTRILAIAGRHGATNLRVFGSVARGEAGPESDLDLPRGDGTGRRIRKTPI